MLNISCGFKDNLKFIVINLLGIKEAQAVILGVVALIIVILSVKKWGWKSLIYWLILEFIAYILLSNAVFG